MESFEVRIKRQGDGAEFRSDLMRNWDPGYVADITLVDGTEVAGVLIGISNSALILDRWDSDIRAPAGDPITLDLRLVAEVVVP